MAFFKMIVSCGRSDGLKKAGKTDAVGEQPKYDLNSPAVVAHMSIIGEIVNRLATNSNYCKTICVAIVTVFAAFSKDPDWKSLGVWLIPIVAIGILDSLFVYTKKRITKEGETFVENVENNLPVKPYNLYKPKICEKIAGTLKCLGDISIWLFYGAMIVTLALHILLTHSADVAN